MGSQKSETTKSTIGMRTVATTFTRLTVSLSKVFLIVLTRTVMEAFILREEVFNVNFPVTWSLTFNIPTMNGLITSLNTLIVIMTMVAREGTLFDPLVTFTVTGAAIDPGLSAVINVVLVFTSLLTVTMSITLITVLIKMDARTETIPFPRHRTRLHNIHFNVMIDGFNRKRTRRSFPRNDLHLTLTAPKIMTTINTEATSGRSRSTCAPSHKVKEVRQALTIRASENILDRVRPPTPACPSLQPPSDERHVGNHEHGVDNGGRHDYNLTSGNDIE